MLLLEQRGLFFDNLVRNDVKLILPEATQTNLINIFFVKKNDKTADRLMAVSAL